MRILSILALFLTLFSAAHADGIINPGAGGGGGSGTVTSIATGCQATGGTITTTGTISTQTVITDLAGSNPSIVGTYCGGLENLDNSSAQTPTIAVSGSGLFVQGWYTDLCNINTGAQTLTPGSGTIGGQSSYTLAAGTKTAPNCVRIISDAANTNYVLEFPPSAGSVTASSTTTFTNKTLTSSTNSLGGVTAAFGSDAKGDIYTNGGSSNVITRLGIGSTGNCLVVASGLPSWAACPAGTITAGTTATSGITSGDLIGSTSNLIVDSNIAFANVVLLNAANALTGANSWSANGQNFSATGAVTTPNIVLGVCGSQCGIYATATGKMCFVDISGTCEGDYAITSASAMTLTPQVNFSSSSIFFTSGGTTSLTANNAAIKLASSATGGATTLATQAVTGAISAGAISLTAGGASGSGVGSGASVNITAGASTSSSASSGGGSVVITLGTASTGSPGTLQFVNLPSSSAAQTGTLCYNTSGNGITYDPTLGCLSSLEELKNIHGPIRNALVEEAAIKPFWFTPIERPSGSDTMEQPGYGAHQVESVDKRLVAYGPDGKLRGVRYMEMSALHTAAINELSEDFKNLKAENDNLRAEIEDLKRRVH
jgi:hypothetical protein